MSLRKCGVLLLFNVIEIDSLADDSIISEMTGTSYLRDEDCLPYLVIDPMGRRYWFSPLLGESVVIQGREGRC